MKILASKVLAVLCIGMAAMTTLAQNVSIETITDREREVVLTDGFDYIVKYYEKRDVNPSENLEKVLKKVRKVDASVQDLSDLELVRVLVNELS